MGAAATVPKENSRTHTRTSPSELIATLRTGDVLLFQGNGWQATLERWFTWCEYSHIGMVQWRMLGDTDMHGNRVPTACLWESVGHLDAHTCVLHGRRKTGVRLVRLAEKIDDYIAANAWREVRVCSIPLHARAAKRESMEALFERFVNETCGIPYQTSAIGMLCAAYPVEFGAAYATPLSGYTCNQLVAATLVRIHAYKSSMPIGSITLRGFLDGALLDAWSDDAILDQINYHWIIGPPLAYT
jgi:hypothetical protein